jgi:hypothetical protein
MSQKITRFDRSSVAMLADLLFSMMLALAPKFGLTVERLEGPHSDNVYDFRVRFKTANATADEDPTHQEPSGFRLRAAQVGVPANAWNKVVTVRGERFRVEDVKPRNRKYPVIATRLRDGSRRKMGVLYVEAALREACGV